MKVRAQVTRDKLRGGFYTPTPLVNHCFKLLRNRLSKSTDVRLLEPTAGDGAFLRGAVDANIRFRDIIAVEIDTVEASRARHAMDTLELPGVVVNASVLNWMASEQGEFDAVVGNLPFVRFQFVDELEKRAARQHASRLGIDSHGVANLWLPILLTSISCLRTGGAFAIVLPTELFTGVSAGVARQWLLGNTVDLRCDLYPPGSFPNVLQEVLLLSGTRCDPHNASHASVTIAQHSKTYSSSSFNPDRAEVHKRSIPVSPAGWTKYHLGNQHIAALEEINSLTVFSHLRDLARLEVSIVTGANQYFSLTLDEVDRFNLQNHVVPLLPRVRNAPGLRFTAHDYNSNVDAGNAAFLFDGRTVVPDAAREQGLADYLTAGEMQGIHERYKCRIRKPWYAIPGMRRGSLYLSKRSHQYPRLISNETAAVTTDTIYRGEIIPGTNMTQASLTAGFHNSITLLSAELEGRSFGGGVLELVPSEVSRLLVPTTNLEPELDRLDGLAREAANSRTFERAEDVVRETDLVLAKTSNEVSSDLLEAASSARQILLTRRLERSGTSPTP